MKAARLTRKEMRTLAGTSQTARILYVLCIRPYADESGVTERTEDELHEAMCRVYDESGLSLLLVKRELDALVERGLVSRKYSEQAYRVVAGMH